MLPRIPSIASLALAVQPHTQPALTTAIFTVAPECTASSLLHPRSVPVLQWDAARRKYFQAGGLTGADSIAEFLIGLINADVLPQTVKGWLEDLCEIEGTALLRVLEEHHRVSGTGGMTAKKSSMSSRKFSLLGRQPQATGLAGDGKVTPRATSFRMTPRRLSVGATPADEPLLTGHGPLTALVGTGAAAHSASVSSTENALTACLRLRFDWNNVRLLEDVITNILPLRSVIEKGSSSPTLAALQSLSASKPTYDYHRNTGTLTTEQLALLLDFVSEGTTLPRVSHGTSVSRYEVEAREGLDSLLRGEDSMTTTAAAAGNSQARRRLESLLEEMGLSLPPVASYVPSKAEDSSLLGASTHYGASDGTSAAAPASVVHEIEELFRTSEGWDVDEDTDVLKRLTPRRAESSCLSKPHGPGSFGAAMSRRTVPAHQRRANAEPMLPPIATRSASAVERIHGLPGSQLGSGVATSVTPGRLSQRSTAADSLGICTAEYSSFRASDEVVARYDSIYSTRGSAREAPVDADVLLSKLPRAASTAELAALPVAPAAKSANARTSPARVAPLVATTGTQTEAPSFTRLWLGPRMRNVGTSTRASGVVGKVVSVALIRASRARQQLSEAKREAVGRRETFEELRQLGVEELTRRYAASVAAVRRRSPPGDTSPPQQLKSR